MKIYCIKIDSMPFCPEVFEINKLIKGSMSRQVGGCFTTNTVVQMLTGKLTSDLYPHGIGYRTGKEWLSDGCIDWPWLKESLPFDLSKIGYKFISRNPAVISGVLGFLKYPEFYSDSYVPGWDLATNVLGNIGVENALPERFNLSEEEYIKKIQSSDEENVFHFINYNYAHDACMRGTSSCNLYEHQKSASKITLELLKYWDFTEKNALFWIFSDHGCWNFPGFGGYPLIQNFYTWVILKDNTDFRKVMLPSVISAQDFYSLIKYKLDESLIFNKRNIFFTEDGRDGIDPYKSTTAMACEFVEYPTQMTYLIYHEPDNKFLQKMAYFYDNGALYCEGECAVNEDLRNKLIERFRQSWELQLKIGVAITTCDRPDYLLATIDSLKAENAERVIVNNGSGNKEAVNTIAKNHGYTVIDGNESNSPHGHNLAFEYLLEKGCEAVLKADDDLIFEPGYLNKLCSVLSKYNDVAAVSGVCWSNATADYINYIDGTWHTKDGGRINPEQFSMHRFTDTTTLWKSRHLTGAFLYRVKDALELRKRTKDLRGGVFGEYFSRVAGREETELTLLLRQVLHKDLIVEPSAVVFHQYAPGGTRKFDVSRLVIEDDAKFINVCKQLGVDAVTAPAWLGPKLGR